MNLPHIVMPVLPGGVGISARLFSGARMAALALLALLLLSVSACSSTEVEGAYKPVMLPVKFVWGPSGMEISGDGSIVTPIGIFSIGAKYSLPEKDSDAIYVIIRDRKVAAAGTDRTGFDRIYKIAGGAGEFSAVVNGTTTIQVVDRQVLIDVTEGTVRTIQFKRASVAVAEGGPGFWDRWGEYWDSSFYSPFALARWAYDDSTMSKWFGIGFAWFMIRFVLALICGVLDVILTVACVLAAIAYMFFGTTGQNIVYGLEVLFALLLVLVLRPSR